MISTTYRDGYGVIFELWHAEPEVCPDGITRTWVTLTVGDEDAPADYQEHRLQPDDLRELAAVLVAVAEAHDTKKED